MNADIHSGHDWIHAVQTKFALIYLWDTSQKRSESAFTHIKIFKN